MSQRIEVLRGPQGTLFGRNTPAGIVKIDTVRPTNEFDARGSVSFGSHETVALDAAVGGPIVTDRLAGRISVMLQRRSDFIDNGFTGEDDAYGGYSDFAARAQLLFTPTDRLSFLALGQYREPRRGEHPVPRQHPGTGQQRAERELRPRDGVLRRRRRQPRRL